MYGDDNMNYHIMLSLHGMHLPQVHFTLLCILEVADCVSWYSV